MDVTLLYFDDCPNWRVADGHLRTLASEIPDRRVGLSCRVYDTSDGPAESPTIDQLREALQP